MKATLEITNVPPQTYACIDGVGHPENNPDFQAAILALYGVSYTLKFTRKKAGREPGYKVSHLEGLWTVSEKRPDWRWTLMIAQPDFIEQPEFAEATETLAKKKPNPTIAKLYLKQLAEGAVVQIMHIGPYDHEGPDINAMQAYAAEKGYLLTGRHHEIYLGDPRRANPERLRTLLRHPVKPG